jgi:hypothetical protein
MGQALILTGQFAEAQKSLRQCLSLLPAKHANRLFASQLLRLSQQLLDADDRLNAYRAGKGDPGDARTCIQMATLAQHPSRRLYLSAARLFAVAFARQPQLAVAHRYNAAWAAALAGTGQSKDTAGLDDTTRAELRYSALSWLQDQLAVLNRQLGDMRPGSSEQVLKALQHWRTDSDLAAVRDPAALAKLHEAEQVAWLNLWAQVDSLLARTTPSK